MRSSRSSYRTTTQEGLEGTSGEWEVGAGRRQGATGEAAKSDKQT